MGAMDEAGKKQVAELLGVEPTASAEDVLTALNGLDDEKKKKATELIEGSKSSAEAKDAKKAVDVSGLTYKAKHDDNLKDDPEDPKFRVALVGCYVNSHPTGGSDKVTSGHRFDSVGIANGLKNAGLAVQILFYNVDEHDRFFEVVP